MRFESRTRCPRTPMPNIRLRRCFPCLVLLCLPLFCGVCARARLSHEFFRLGRRRHWLTCARRRRDRRDFNPGPTRWNTWSAVGLAARSSWATRLLQRGIGYADEAENLPVTTIRYFVCIAVQCVCQRACRILVDEGMLSWDRTSPTCCRARIEERRCQRGSPGAHPQPARRPAAQHP